MNLSGKWERRWHPLLQEWVILAAVTSERPWSGETVKALGEEGPAFDPNCYLCPGVVRASGVKNPNYTGPWAFTNDFASFSFDAPDVHLDSKFQRVRPVHGTCRVICYTPRHNVTLAQLSLEEVEAVVRLWKSEYENLSKHEKIDNVLIFENKGKVIGVSNPHPHGQIYATNFVPRIVERQRNSFVTHYREQGSHLLEDLLQEELQHGKRIVYENEHFVAFVPFFARFVYETYIVPRKQVPHIAALTDEQLKSLAEIHKVMLTKFDRLYQMSFPNITMLQNAPCDGNPDNALFHFHIEFYPPLRAPDKMKYLAGFESGGGNIINPVMPDEAAQQLRSA